jgi:hypothetical protein
MEREDFFRELLELNLLLLEAKERKDIEAIRIMINDIIMDYKENENIKTYLDTGVNQEDFDLIY